MATRLTSVETVHDDGSYLFTATDHRGDLEEVTVVPCDDGVEAWVNTCTHEYQRLDHGGDIGAVIHDGQLVCPKHGSLFDTCDGNCDNGPAAGSPLVRVDISVNRGTVFLTDDSYNFEHTGGIEEHDDLPDSTSHLRF